MKKQTAIILVLVLALAGALAALAWANSGEAEGKKQQAEKGEFTVSAAGESYTITAEDYEALGPVKFTAVMNTSSTGPVEKAFAGVEARLLLQSLGVEVSEGMTVEFTAADGYASALTGTDLLKEGAVYICAEMDGEPLGTKEDGGSGPYMMVYTLSPFSNTWCKFLADIKVK